MIRVSVIIPVYYNEQSLPELFRELQQVEAAVWEQDAALELIFVDDGSGDHSFAELLKIREARPETRLVRLTRNFGSMHAVKAGLSLVTGDCFLVLAADLQDPPELILRALERRRAGSKYVLCARASREDPPATRLMSGIYYRLLRLTVTPDYPEGGYDVALMDKCFLPYLINSSKNVNPFLFAFWLGYSPDIITYERRARKHGKSRWTLSKKVKFFLDSLLGFSVVPIRFISVVGIVVSCLSFLYGVFIIVCALAGIQTVHGFPTIVTLISFLLGLIIVMLGVIGGYIWRIFDELNRRPESVIDEIY